MRRLSFLAVFLVAMLWPQLAHAATLSVSSSPTHSAPAPLSGQTLSGNQYIFTDVGPVTFRLDGVVRRTENIAPWDFNGSTGSNGIPFNVDALSAGSHTVTATLSAQTLSGTFTVGSAPPPPPPPSGYRPPFYSGVVFNNPIPPGKPDDPNSSAFVTEWTRTVRANPTSTHLKTSGEVPAINYTAGCPFRSFQTGNVSGQFPLCSDLKLGSGSDHPTVAINGTDELRIWQASWDGTTLRGTLGGRFCRADSISCLGQAYAGGGAGNGLTYTAGLNVPADFTGTSTPQHAGRVALDGRFVRSSFRPPARKSDQNSTASYAVPMGSVVQIRPSVNCEARTHQVARDLCHQFQTYGLMVADGSSSNQVVIYHEDNVTANWSNVFGSACSSGNWSCRIRPGASATDGLPWSASDWRVVAAPVSATQW